ncbi:MAG: hypothetical protein JWP70_63 [Leifsonia sp.]|jgi:hypothetical protein|nr:hypothetical protein [Leifsonia sp.]MDQ1588012.1 hypothetical protein [Microbacteriaceae bacterium]
MSRNATDAHVERPVTKAWRRLRALPCRSRTAMVLASAASLVVLALGVLAGILSS